MITIIRQYIANIKYQDGFIQLFVIFILPFLLILLLKFIGINFNDFWAKSGNNFISGFSIPSGFILSSLSIILSNTKITSNQLLDISIKYKSFRKNEFKNANEWLKKIKEILVIESIIQILYTIFFVVLISLNSTIDIKNPLINYFSFLLFYILFSIIFMLIYIIVHFIRYINIVGIGFDENIVEKK